MILVGGGARSGKSTAALRILRASGSRLGLIATAQASDDEMRDRIQLHRATRGSDIVTWEEPYAVAERIAAEDGKFEAIVVDCLTLWLNNLMLREICDIEKETHLLIDSAVHARTQIILVTNEVGCGIVPGNALARRFRDEAGRLNQLAAAKASQVYWMLFGIELRIKS
jgi:adenosylcobinamide kinase/adenosylcobinamide-phosphate guanylyltransferase